MTAPGHTGSGSGPAGDPGQPGANAPGDATATGQTATEIPAGTLLADRFRIDRQLGMGGMGVVYAATDTALDVPVALKLLRMEVADRPGAFERFRQELLLSRQISSPHVVRIHDIAQHQGRWLISMDLVEGEPLDRILDARGPLPVEEAVAIARQIALGLGAAHARQVIHRDLKPSNILVDAKGAVTIVDFGIARSLGTRGLTMTGMVVGTPDYLSPEQARAEPVDSRSDLYALGLLLYEMLSGRPPFSGGTSAESLTQRLTAPPPGIRKTRPDAPAWLEALVARLLSTRPSHRLQTADEVIKAIDARRVPRTLPRALLAKLLVGALVAVALAGLWATRPGPEPGPIPAASGPTPDRLVVLAVDNRTGDPALDDALAGYTDLLRQGVAMQTTVVVVDGERVDQAIAQLGLSDAEPASVDARAVLREARATLLLRPRLVKSAQGYSFSATLWRQGETGDKVLAPVSPDALAAANGFAHALATRLQPDSRPEGRLLPTRLDAMSVYGEGVRARRAGQLETALARFAAASALDPDFGAAWLAQAQTAFLAGRAEASGLAAERGLVLATPRPMHAELTQWKAIAGGDVATSIASQLARVRSAPDDLDASLRLAFLQGQAGQFVPATARLRELLERDSNDPRAWFLLGKFSIMRGEFRAAVDEHLVRALVLFKRGRNRFGEAETVNALGVGYARLGQTDDASEQFSKAVQLRRALGDRRGVASSLRNLSQQAIVQGRFADAQAQLDEARGLFLGLSDQDGLSAVENELGLLAEERGDFVAAQAAFRRMLRSREQAGDDQGVAESMNNIGFAQFQLGDYDSANVYWRQALAAFSKLEDPNGMAQARQNLGALEIARGRWKQARELLEQSLEVAEKHQMVEEAAVSRYYLADLELLEGRLGTALQLADGALRLFAERKDQRGTIDAGWLRARILFAANAGSQLDAVIGELTPGLDQASDEQKAIAALLRAQVALDRGDARTASVQLASARTLATSSGVQMLKLRAAILSSDRPATLEEQVNRLGNLPVRLEWLERMLRLQLAAADVAAAGNSYREARSALARNPDAYAALGLHALGAEALARAGDAAGATAARTTAQTALVRVRASLPASLKPEFENSRVALQLAGKPRG